MPISTCQVCNRKYHFAEKWAKSNPHYGPDRCFDCNQGSTPESWAREPQNKSSFDASPYKAGHFAHVLVQQSYSGDSGEYMRVRIRETHSNGSIITFCGRHFIHGVHKDRSSYTWTLKPLTAVIEDVILRKEMKEEIDKLWDCRKYNLSSEELSTILEILRSR